MRLTGLKTKITTPLVEETIAFYEAAIGLERLEEWDEPNDRGCILGLPNGRGEAFLEIYDGPAGADYGSVGLQFRVADLDAFRSRIEGRVPCRGPVQRPWGSRYLFLTDPNGVTVVVFEGGL